MEVNVDAGEVSKNVTDGLKNERTAPYYLFAIIFVFSFALSAFSAYIVIKLMEQSNKNYSDTLNAQLQTATQQVKQFNETIAITNVALIQLKEQFNEFKAMQNQFQYEIRDHEKRLLKLEYKSKLK